MMLLLIVSTHDVRLTDPQNSLSDLNKSFSGSSRSVWEYSSDGDKEELCSREDSLQNSSNDKFGTYRVFLSPTYDSKNKVRHRTGHIYSLQPFQ